MQGSENKRKSAWLERREIDRHKWNVIQEMKTAPCVDCGRVFDPVCMDYHHIDPATKSNTVAKLLTSRSLERVLAEIDKCVLLCACCHRLRHKGDQRIGPPE